MYSNRGHGSGTAGLFGFLAEGLELRVWGLGLGVWVLALGLEVQGLGFKIGLPDAEAGLED